MALRPQYKSWLLSYQDAMKLFTLLYTLGSLFCLSHCTTCNKTDNIPSSNDADKGEAKDFGPLYTFDMKTGQITDVKPRPQHSIMELPSLMPTASVETLKMLLKYVYISDTDTQLVLDDMDAAEQILCHYFSLKGSQEKTCVMKPFTDFLKKESVTKEEKITFFNHLLWELYKNLLSDATIQDQKIFTCHVAQLLALSVSPQNLLQWVSTLSRDELVDHISFYYKHSFVSTEKLRSKMFFVPPIVNAIGQYYDPAAEQQLTDYHMPEGGYKIIQAVLQNQKILCEAKSPYCGVDVLTTVKGLLKGFINPVDFSNAKSDDKWTLNYDKEIKQTFQTFYQNLIANKIPRGIQNMKLVTTLQKISQEDLEQAFTRFIKYFGMFNNFSEYLNWSDLSKIITLQEQESFLYKEGRSDLRNDLYVKFERFLKHLWRFVRGPVPSVGYRRDMDKIIYTVPTFNKKLDEFPFIQSFTFAVKEGLDVMAENGEDVQQIKLFLIVFDQSKPEIFKHNEVYLYEAIRKIPQLTLVHISKQEAEALASEIGILPMIEKWSYGGARNACHLLSPVIAAAFEKYDCTSINDVITKIDRVELGRLVRDLALHPRNIAKFSYKRNVVFMGDDDTYYPHEKFLDDILDIQVIQENYIAKLAPRLGRNTSQLYEKKLSDKFELSWMSNAASANGADCSLSMPRIFLPDTFGAEEYVDRITMFIGTFCRPTIHMCGARRPLPTDALLTSLNACDLTNTLKYIKAEWQSRFAASTRKIPFGMDENALMPKNARLRDFVNHLIKNSHLITAPLNAYLPNLLPGLQILKNQNENFLNILPRVDILKSEVIGLMKLRKVHMDLLKDVANICAEKLDAPAAGMLKEFFDEFFDLYIHGNVIVRLQSLAALDQ